MSAEAPDSNGGDYVTMPPCYEEGGSSSSGSDSPRPIMTNPNHNIAKTRGSSSYLQMSDESNFGPLQIGDATLPPTIPDEIARQQRLYAETVNHRWSVFCCTIASLALIFALIAMLVEADFIACLAFAFPMITAPYVIGQRRQLNKLPAFREELNRLRKRANRLYYQNNRWTQQNNRLEQDLTSLKASEQKFKTIVRQQGSSIPKVKQLVKENAEITRQMTQLQEAQQIQNLMQAILKADREGDFKLSELEMEQFIVRLMNFSPRKLNEQKLRRAFGKSNSISGIMSIGSDLLDEAGEYETFSFPRANSQKKGTVQMGGMRMNLNNPGII